MGRRRQLELFAASKAPVRKRPGGKRAPTVRAERVGFVPHVTRAAHAERHPVHITMRRVALAPNLRAEVVYRVIERELVAVKAFGVRVLHYSVQPDHLHLVVESHDAKALSRQMQRLFSRLARMVNRVANRRGSLFRDRHHRHELRTPTEVRRALVYVLFNTRKHQPSYYAFDRCSSMRWFQAWSPERAPAPGHLEPPGPAAPVSEPRTWLAAKGWQRAGGLVRFDELPRRQS